MNESCIKCEKPYRKNSVPVCAFNRKLEMTGTVHTGCAPALIKEKGLSHHYCNFTQPERGRRYLWLLTYQKDPHPIARAMFLEQESAGMMKNRGAPDPGKHVEEALFLEKHYQNNFPNPLRIR